MAARRRRELLKHINSYWHRLHELAELEDLRLDDKHHSFSSQALAIGEELPTIARLLGHKMVLTTYRYAQLAEDGEKASVARVADSIGNNLLSSGPGLAAQDGRRGSDGWKLHSGISHQTECRLFQYWDGSRQEMAAQGCQV